MMSLLLILIQTLSAAMLAKALGMLLAMLSFGCILLIVKWVFHPKNKTAYESYAFIPLDDLLEDESKPESKPKDYFSIFL